MLYFTRQLYMEPPDAPGKDQDGNAFDYDEAFEVASKAYAERLSEIQDDLPKSIRKLLEDEHWNAEGVSLRFVDDHFYIVPAEEIAFMLTDGYHIFILRYTLDDQPVVEAPSEEEQVYFPAEDLRILADEWDTEDGVFHRLLLNNGYIVKFKVNAFRWWKVKVEAEA